MAHNTKLTDTNCQLFTNNESIHVIGEFLILQIDKLNYKLVPLGL